MRRLLLWIVAPVSCQTIVLGLVLSVDAEADEGIQIADFGFHLRLGEALLLGSANQIVGKSLNGCSASPRSKLLVRVNAVL